MTEEDALLAAVAVHKLPSKDYVRLSEIPVPWRQPFASALRGSAVPVIDGEGPCAWALDWQQWVRGAWTGRPGPFQKGEC